MDAFIITTGKYKEEVICYQISPSIIQSAPLEDTKDILSNIKQYEKKRTEVFKPTHTSEHKANEITFSHETNYLGIDSYYQIYLYIECNDVLKNENKCQKSKKKFARLLLMKDLNQLNYENLFEYIRPITYQLDENSIIQMKFVNEKGNKEGFIEYCLECSNAQCQGCFLRNSIDPPLQVDPRSKIPIEIRLDQINPNIDPLPLSISQSAKSLEQCIKRYSNSAELIGDWTCRKCFTTKKATKSMQVYTAPLYLLIQFKREKDPNPELITYPITGLDMSEFIVEGANKKEESLVYDLRGVINYSTMILGGHYTTTVKHFKTDQWYIINDSLVAPINEKDVVSPLAVVLLYERRNIDIEKLFETKIKHEPNLFILPIIESRPCWNC